MTSGIFTLREVVAAQRASTWDAPAICSQAASFFARLGTTPSDADKAIYNRFIMRLVASPVWNKLDGLYVSGGPIEATGLMNLRQAAYDGTNVGARPFTAYKGFSGATGSGSISSNYTPDGSHHYKQNDACVFCYFDTADAGSFWGISGGTTFDKLEFYPRFTTDQRSMRFNSDTEINTVYSLDGGGLIAMDRSDAGGWYVCQHGVKVPHNGSAQYVTGASTGLPTSPISFAGGTFTRHLSIFGFGGSLTDDDHKTLNSACETLAQAFGFYVEPPATALSAVNLRRKSIIVPYSAVAPKAVETWPVLYNGQLLAISFDWGYSTANPHIVVRTIPDEHSAEAGTIIANNEWTGGGIYGFAGVFGGMIHIFGSVNLTRNIVHATLDPTTYAPSAPVVIATGNASYGAPTNLSVVQDATGYALSSEDYQGGTHVIEFFHSAALGSGWASLGTYVPPNYYGQSFLRYRTSSGVYYLIYGSKTGLGPIGYDAIVKTTSLAGGGTWTSPTATRQVLWPLVSEGTNSQIVGMIDDGRGNVEMLYLDGDQGGWDNVRRAQVRDISVADLCASYFV